MKKFIVIILLIFANNKPHEHSDTPLSFDAKNQESVGAQKEIEISDNLSFFKKHGLSNSLSRIQAGSTIADFLYKIVDKKGKKQEEVDFFYRASPKKVFNAWAYKKSNNPGLAKDTIIISRQLYDLLRVSFYNKKMRSCAISNSLVTMSSARAQGLVTAIIEHELRHLDQVENYHTFEYILNYTDKNVCCLLAGALLYQVKLEFPHPLITITLASTIASWSYYSYKWTQGIWHYLNKTSEYYEWDADNAVSNSRFILECYQLSFEIRNLIMLHEVNNFPDSPDVIDVNRDDLDSKYYDQLYYRTVKSISHPTHAQRIKKIKERIRNLQNQDSDTPTTGDEVTIQFFNEAHTYSLKYRWNLT